MQEGKPVFVSGAVKGLKDEKQWGFDFHCLAHGAVAPMQYGALLMYGMCYSSGKMVAKAMLQSMLDVFQTLHPPEVGSH